MKRRIFGAWSMVQTGRRSGVLLKSFYWPHLATETSQALAGGWPVFEVLFLVADLYGGEQLPADCRSVESDIWGLEKLIGDPEIMTECHTGSVVYSIICY